MVILESAGMLILLDCIIDSVHAVCGTCVSYSILQPPSWSYTFLTPSLKIKPEAGFTQ